MELTRTTAISRQPSAISQFRIAQSEESVDDSRKDAKDAKFGEDILTADSRRYSQMTIHRRDALRWTQGGERDRTTAGAENYFYVCRETATNKNISPLGTKGPSKTLREVLTVVFRS